MTARRTRMTAPQRRESILDAATTVFAEAGYHRTRASDIAARLGISEPVVFQNFGSKAALYAAVLDRVVGQSDERLNALLVTDVGSHRSVSALLAHVLAPEHVERMHSRGALGALLADAAGLTGDPEVAEPARHAIARVAQTLAGLLREGQQAGDIRADLDPEAGAWWLVTLLSASAFRAAVMPDPAVLEPKLVAMTLGMLVSSTE